MVAPLSAIAARTVQPTWVALAAILAVGLAFRVVFFYGLVNVDPFAYADSAESIRRMQPVFDPDLLGGTLYFTQYIRLSLTVPTAIVYELFGASDATSTAFPIAAALGTGVVNFALARRIAGDLAGLIAAFLTVTFPPLVANSTQFLPDTVMTFFAALSILLFLRATGEERPRSARAWLYFGAGIAFAGSFYARPTAVALLAPFAVILALRQVPRRAVPYEVLAAAAGALLVIAAANALLVRLGADPLQDIRVILQEGRGTAPGALQYTDIDWSYARTVVRDPLFWPFTGLALAGVTLLIACDGWRSSARGDVLALAILVAGEYLYFEFLMRLPGLYSWWKEPRYILPMVMPALVLGACGLARWVQRSEPRVRLATGTYVGMALLAVTLWGAQALRDDRDTARANRVDALARATAGALASRPTLPVYVSDEDYARPLSYRLGIERATLYDRIHDRGRVRDRFDIDGHSLVTPDSYVVLLPGDNSWTRAAAPAPWWDLEWELPGKLAVYHVPASPPASAVVLKPLPAPVTMDGLPAIVAAGLSSGTVLPNRPLAVVLGFATPLPPAANFEASTNCGIRSRALRIAPAAGATDTRLELPVDASPSATPASCTVEVNTRPGDWRPVATFTVPAFLSDEPETRFTVDPAREKDRGWYSVYQPVYGGGGAVVAEAPFRPLAVPLARLAAGSYWVDMAVYDYGTGGPNAVAVRLNGVERTAGWAGDAAPAGVRHVVVAFPDVPAGADLTVTIVAAGQPAVVIDTVTVVGADPAELVPPTR
ncbi:MAG: glycosyltransferase family 39 protein [Chloroflexi bacterium]|nr:glycosyltransferase family 39 protein [Chloroflexota bacterium]